MSFPFTQVPKPKRVNRGKKMAALIEEEGLDEDGRPMKCGNLHRQQKRKHKPAKKIAQEEDKDDDDDEDGEFSDSSSGDKSSLESESDVSHHMIPGHEISDMLPSKTAPSTKRTKSTTRAQQIQLALASSKAKSMTHAKKKPRKATVEEVEVEDSSRNAVTRNRAASPDPSAPTETMTSSTEQRKKDMLSPLSEFSQEVVTQSRCDGQVFGLKPSKF
ncbi:hypothetical protein JB92DRAFT_3119314 [Gautieria morchelliformis]|nr:hypothetical protein JB92DRAFT_3119314 [Gautieria morchelliformis]